MLASNLKKILEDKEISVSELAKKTGVPKSTILTWLAGRTPDLIQLDKVTQFLDVSIDEIAFDRKREDILSQLFEKVEVHSGLYEISIKKVSKK